MSYPSQQNKCFYLKITTAIILSTADRQLLQLFLNCRRRIQRLFHGILKQLYSFSINLQLTRLRRWLPKAVVNCFLNCRSTLPSHFTFPSLLSFVWWGQVWFYYYFPGLHEVPFNFNFYKIKCKDGRYIHLWNFYFTLTILIFAFFSGQVMKLL